MRPRPSPAVYEQLLALREAQAQLSRHTLRVNRHDGSNEAVRQTLMDAARMAADHARRLDPLLPHLAPDDDADPAGEPEPRDAATNREVVESWIAVAEDACELYEHAADHAPSGTMASELRRLALEEARVVESLRDLL